MKRKIVSLLLVLAMLATSLLLATSCVGNGPAGELSEFEFDTSKPVTITFYHTMGESLRAVLDKHIAKFNELYPNITIEHKQVGGYDDVREQIKTEITVGDQPNIAYCYPDHVALYNLAMAVQTLDDLIAATNTVTRADGTTEQLGLTQAQIDNFIDGYYNEGKQFGDGKMYTLPMSKSTEVLYYNKTFFDAHPELKVPTTWEELKTVCAQIKAIDPESIPLGYDSESNWFITMCEQLGTPYTSATGEHFLFDNEDNHAFVKEFREWYKAGYVTTQEISGGYTSALFTKNPAEAGNCYMCIGSSAGANHQIPKNDDGTYKFEVGIASIPQANKEAPKVISQGPSICIFKKADSQEVLASWLFVKYLTTTVDFQAEFGMTSGYVPVLENVTDNAVYAEELEHANGYEGLPLLATKVCLEQANAYYTSPAFNGSSAARDEVGKLMQICLTTTEADIDAAIKKAFADAVAECKYQAGE
ncbi:MAG: extracellular solute-binding protein [Clostridia bacterium]|nr:extracellular solute-binding protein [Clostridia bacterium]MBQ5661858.1 extracellular solute-binding protein [Clostridia bacterium]